MQYNAPVKQEGLPFLAKKAFDRLVALGVLTATAPILGVAALAVRSTMGTPVVFRQPRPGVGGKEFRIYKLRTMTSERDASGQLLPDAQRLTALGKFLRRTSLDELPQLLNVVAGDMSLVGPRPLLMQYLPLYNEEQRRRHDVLPGITGWAQINGRNALTWEEKFKLDVWYVDHWSLALDARILLATAVAVVNRRGIAAEGNATMPVFQGNG